MRWKRLQSLTLALVGTACASCANATIHDELRAREPVPSGAVEEVAVASVEATPSIEPTGAEGTRPLASTPDAAGAKRTAPDAAERSTTQGGTPDAPPALGARGPRGKDDPSSRTPAIRGFAPTDDDVASGAARSPRRATRPARRGSETRVPEVLGIPWWALAAALVVGCAAGVLFARRRSRRALLALRRRADAGHAWRTFRTRLDAPGPVTSSRRG